MVVVSVAEQHEDDLNFLRLCLCQGVSAEEGVKGHMASTSTGGAWARSTGDVAGYWDDFLARLMALDMTWPTRVDFSKEIILARKKS